MSSCSYIIVLLFIFVLVSSILQVSQAAEDLFTLLAPSIPSESGVELLAPMALKEKHPMLLGIIKLLTKVEAMAMCSAITVQSDHPFECLSNYNARTKCPPLYDKMVVLSLRERGDDHVQSDDSPSI